MALSNKVGEQTSSKCDTERTLYKYGTEQTIYKCDTEWTICKCGTERTTYKCGTQQTIDKFAQSGLYTNGSQTIYKYTIWCTAEQLEMWHIADYL